MTIAREHGPEWDRREPGTASDEAVIDDEIDVTPHRRHCRAQGDWLDEAISLAFVSRW